MSIFRRTLPLCILVLFVGAIVAPHVNAAVAQEPQPSGQTPTPAVGNAPPQEEQAPEGYTLTPEQREKAIAYSNANYVLYFVGFVYGLLVLWVVLRWKCAPRFRDWAERATKYRFVQALIYAPLLFLTLAILGLPTEIYGQWLSKKYDQSIQSWGSWLWDWAKVNLVLLMIGTLVVWILYAIVRKSPKLCWFYFWLVSLPILIVLISIAPVVIVPLIYPSEPLTNQHAEFVAQIEQVTQRGGLEIPRERMFLLKVGEKTKSLNAGVMGLGASKRVIFFDTIFKKMNSDQALFGFGHEMGHYVLNHIWKNLAFTALLFLVFFYAGYVGGKAMLRQWGERWGIRSLDDWASLPVILLLLSVVGFLASPIQNTFVRHLEHEADIYGLEVVHGLVPNAPAAAARAFQILGETNLADPEPSEFIKIWMYNHPPLGERITFARSYDPWSKGEPPEFVKD